MRKTKAAVFDAPGQPLRITTLDLADPAPCEVLVRLAASGVCHSDYHVALGEWSGPTPLVLGHEGAGVVEAVGSEVSSVEPGDHVVLSWMPYCRQCRYCLAGRPNLCELTARTSYESVLLDGTTRLRENGDPVYSYLATASLSEYTVVPETAAVPIRKDVPLPLAALVGCAVATGVGAVLNTARVEAGSSVLVVGCGGVGLSTLMGAALTSSDPLIAVDRNDETLELARHLGATHTINADRSDVQGTVRDIVGPEGVDYAFEAIGLPPTLELCHRVTGPAGTTVVVGQVAEGATMSIDPFELSDREKRLIGSNYGSCRPPEDFPKLLDLAKRGRLDLAALVGRTVPLEEVNSAFDAMGRGETGRTVILFEENQYVQ